MSGKGREGRCTHDRRRPYARQRGKHAREKGRMCKTEGKHERGEEQKRGREKLREKERESMSARVSNSIAKHETARGKVLQDRGEECMTRKTREKN